MKKPAKKYLVIDVTNGEGYSTPSIYPFLSLGKALNKYNSIKDEYEKIYDYDSAFFPSDLKEQDDPLLAKYICHNGQDNMGVHLFEIPADCVPVVEIDTNFADEITVHVMETHKQAAMMIITKSEEFPLEDEEDEDENNEYLHAGNHSDGHVYVEAITDQKFNEADEQIAEDENPKDARFINSGIALYLPPSDPFDEIEIHPCHIIGHEEGKDMVEQCEEKDAEFWGVYAHYIPTLEIFGSDCIADTKTKEQAEELKKMFDKIYSLAQKVMKDKIIEQLGDYDGMGQVTDQMKEFIEGIE